MSQSGLYLEKSLFNSSAHENTCWRSIRGDIDLMAVKGALTFVGYRGPQFCADGAASADVRVIQVDLADIPEWNVFYQAVARKITTEVGGVFEGGQLKVLPSPTPTEAPTEDSAV